MTTPTEEVKTHGCPGEHCRVCHLDRLLATSPLPRAATLAVLRDHHNRQTAHYWAALEQEDQPA